jgi:hypothetical protein
MMTIRCLSLALLITITGIGQSRADDAAERLLTAFRNICLVKPDSVWAIDALATHYGFTRASDPPTTVNVADIYNLIFFWRLGDGESKVTLNGLALDNNPLHYALLCEMDANGVPPEDLIAALKTTASLGEPKEEKHQDSTRITLSWKIPADPRQDVLRMEYDSSKGRQHIGLSFKQDIRTPIEN